MNSVSVIIPAYNEGQRISRVLQVLREVDFIEKIFVVDDGSKDNTAEVVTACQSQDARIMLIRKNNNLGKGQAIITAWELTKTPYILMLDADLKGLRPEHVQNLCAPVLHGKADMTIGLFRHGHFATDFSHWITPWLSGQRCLRSELFECVSDEASRGYGIETALTVLSHQMHLKVVRVYLIGMSHPPGEIHRGSLPGILNRIRMYRQIIHAWYLASTRRHEIKIKQTENNN